MTRFTMNLMPKDGSPHIHLYSDHDLVIVPREGDSVGLDTDYGVTSEVRSVTIYPTCDPEVYVRCRSLTPATRAEAEEIARAAVGYGWVTGSAKP